MNASATIGARRFLLICGLFALMLLLASIIAAAQLRWFGVILETAADGQTITVASVSDEAAQYLHPGQVIVALEGDGRRVALEPQMFVPSPGTLNRYSDMRHFYADQGRLEALLDAPVMTVIGAQGTVLAELPVTRRGFAGLPLLFWVQIFSGLLSLSVVTALVAYRPTDIAVRYFAVTGLCFFVGMIVAAVFSTRPLSLAPEFFQPALSLVRIAILGFIAAFLSLLWHFPVALGSARVPALFFLGYALVKFLDFSQWVDSVNLAYRAPLLLGVAAAFVLSILQWQRAGHDPLLRAMLRWFFLFLFCGVAIYFGGSLLLVQGKRLPIHVSYLMTLVGVTYLGTAWVIARYPLFNLERWWLETWIWFVGGMLVLVSDAVFSYFLGTGDLSLPMALALSGWVYFPLRQLLLRTLSRHNRTGLEEVFPRVIEFLFAHADGGDVDKSWRELLSRTFAPLEIADNRVSCPTCGIADNGLAMIVPQLEGGGSLALRYAEGGAYLFSSRHEHIAQSMFDLLRLGLSYRQAYLRGQTAERERIAHDLHDDIGARLLTLIHRAPTPGDADIARAAMQDLRTLLSALDERPRPLAEAIADWRAEAESRGEAAGIRLNWCDEIGILVDQPLLSPRQRINLERLVREALTNAIRHAHATRLDVDIVCRPPDLRIAIRDDGIGLAPDRWRQGRGTLGMERRAREIGGHVEVTAVSPHGTEIVVSLDLTEAA